MDKIDIAGLKVDAITKTGLMDILRERISQGKKTFVTTLYSEFLYAALKDRQILDMLNKADIAVADGIGVIWAAKYLSIPLTAKNYWLMILQALWQAIYSGAAIVFRPDWIKNIPASVIPSGAERSRGIPLTTDKGSPACRQAQALSDSAYGQAGSAPPLRQIGRGDMDGYNKIQLEKIVGADLVWDLAKLAADNNLSIYLLGGFGDTPELAAKKLQAKSYLPRRQAGKLKAFCSNKNPDDPTIIDDIKKANPDLLFVAYGPLKQEVWITHNLPNLPVHPVKSPTARRGSPMAKFNGVKLAIGLGGTFDYIARKRPNPPRFLRYAGLEWLYRLFTQPHRFKRIFKATFGLVWMLVKYKVFTNLPYRQNVASVVLNEKNEVFIARFNPEKKVLRALGYSKGQFMDYWQLPQGGLEENEDMAECAKRELWEETAMRSLKLLKISEQTYSYAWKDIAQRPLFVKKRFHYKGQQQGIVYFRFMGTEKEIVLDWDEFVEYKWVPWQDLKKELHAEKNALAKIVLTDLQTILR